MNVAIDVLQLKYSGHKYMRRLCVLEGMVDPVLERGCHELLRSGMLQLSVADRVRS